MIEQKAKGSVTDSDLSPPGSVDLILETTSRVALALGVATALGASPPPSGSTSDTAVNAEWVDPSASEAIQQDSKGSRQGSRAKLLAQIREEYERLPQARWFQDVYAGKSLGESLRVL